MCTLITVSGHDSTRRCTAKCYDAQHPDCDCVCHGKNHGAGLQGAIDNTRETAGALSAEYSAADRVLKLADRVLGQIPLFQE